MSTSITRRPGTDVRTPAEKQEDALLARFKQISPCARMKLLRKLKAIVDEDKRRLLNVLRK